MNVSILTMTLKLGELLFRPAATELAKRVLLWPESWYMRSSAPGALAR
jgi:hypothetical protein